MEAFAATPRASDSAATVLTTGALMSIRSPYLRS